LIAPPTHRGGRCAFGTCVVHEDDLPTVRRRFEVSWQQRSSTETAGAFDDGSPGATKVDVLARVVRLSVDLRRAGAVLLGPEVQSLAADQDHRGRAVAEADEERLDVAVRRAGAPRASGQRLGPVEVDPDVREREQAVLTAELVERLLPRSPSARPSARGPRP
jgi:hypothetical protein